jgi:hypothetical protein
VPAAAPTLLFEQALQLLAHAGQAPPPGDPGSLAWQQAMATRALAARDRTVIEARAARFDRLPLHTPQP